jgi:hypothetical protein
MQADRHPRLAGTLSSSAAIPYDFSELKDMIAWRDRIN